MVGLFEGLVVGLENEEIDEEDVRIRVKGGEVVMYGCCGNSPVLLSVLNAEDMIGDR